MFQLKLRKIQMMFPSFQNCVCEENKYNSFHLIYKIVMFRYLFLDIISSSELTVFLEVHPPKTVFFSKQIMSADKYSSIFSCQMVDFQKSSLSCLFSTSHRKDFSNLIGPNFSNPALPPIRVAMNIPWEWNMTCS